jgi:hypothetical protein
MLCAGDETHKRGTMDRMEIRHREESAKEERKKNAYLREEDKVEVHI